MNYEDLLAQMQKLYDDFIAAIKKARDEEEESEGIDMEIPESVSLEGLMAEQYHSKHLDYGDLGKGMNVNITLKLGE